MARYVVAAAALASTAAFQPARPRLAPPMQMVAEDGLRLRSIAPERATEPLVDEALVEEALRSEIADFVEEALGVDEDALVVDGGAAVAPIVVEMDLAKATVDASEGLAGLGGDAIAAVFGDTNFEAAEEANKEMATRGGRKTDLERKFKTATPEELNEKAILYRLASWPNLTQLLFLYSLCLPDAAMWWAGVVERYPNQGVLGYHYGFASAVGYALSMLSETLRDRKLVSLRVDLIILVVGVFLPMVSVGLDGVLLGDTVTVNPLDYWRQFHDVLPPSQIAEVLGEVVPPPSQIAEVVLGEAL
ncbi:hypothetical protein JL722_10497 [Aureococcus anophagefferens]|nr:hypothetical protein JL722_10497 [Aureococcus anophagefferens]